MKVITLVPYWTDMKLLIRIYKKLFRRSFRRRFPPDRYPFSDGLCNFMDDHPECEAALKLSQPKRFITIPLIFTSGLPKGHSKSADEIIGIWYYDKDRPFCKFHNKSCAFKQDFIVNAGSADKEFVVYTAYKSHPPFVQQIKKFFSDYGSNGKFYHDGNKEWEHHYETSSNLPSEPSLRRLANIIETASHW